MKKALVMLLAVILVIGMAVPAYAVSSPVGETSSSTTTADVPEVVETETEDADLVVDLVAADDAEELSEEAEETFAAAQETLKDAAPEGMKVQYFCYVTISGKTDDKPANMTIKIANVTKVVVKQFIDGKWIELKAVLNEDGTVTIFDIVEGPIAIFTK